jgi:hypothetical protein
MTPAFPLEGARNMTDPTPSPDVLNYIVGKGIVSFCVEGTSPDQYIDLGNAPSFTYKADVKSLDHFSSRAGTKSKDYSVDTERSATITLTLDEFSVENLKLALQATIGSGGVLIIGDSTSITGKLRLVGTNDVGPRYQWDFPSVKWTPGKAIELIGDTWGQIELTGDVLLVDGSFGTAVRLS